MFHEAIPLGAVARDADATDWSAVRLRLFWVAATLFCLSAWAGLGWLVHTLWQAIG